MQDTVLIRFHEIILIFYILCLCFYFFDFIQKNNKMKVLGFYTLGIVWILQTISISLYIVETHTLPLNNMSELFYSLSWTIMLMTIVVSLFKSAEFMIFIVNIISFIFLALYTFHPNQFYKSEINHILINELLVIHVALAILSYALFTIAFANGVLYLIQYQNLKRKVFTQKYFRLGSITTFEKAIYYTSLTGVIILFISIILGMQWGLMTVGLGILYDPKVILSMLIIVLYGLYIVFRIRAVLNTKQLIYFNMILFLFCMINFIVVTQFSSFHQWTGNH